MNDQGHAQRTLVDEVTVRVLPVLAQAFAVVGGKNDQRSSQQVSPPEEIPELAQDVVLVSEFGLIIELARGVGLQAGAPSRGKFVGRVQIVQVNEDEEWRRGVRLQPSLGGSRHLFTRSLDVARILSRLPAQVERAVVHIEALIQTKTLVENEAAHKGRGAVPLTLKNGRECHRARLKLFAIIFNTVCKRVG